MAELRESKALESSVVVIAVILGASALFAANEFFIPVTLSLLLTSLLWPVVQGMQRWRIPTAVGAAIAILGTVAILAAAVVAFEAPVRKFANDIPKSIAAARPRLAAMSASLNRFVGAPARRTTPVTPPAVAPKMGANTAAPKDSLTDTTARNVVDSVVGAVVTLSVDSMAKLKRDSAASGGASTQGAALSTDSTGAKAKPKAASDKPGSGGPNFDLSTISGGAPAIIGNALGLASSLLGDFVEIMLFAMFVLAAGSAWKRKLDDAVHPASRANAVAETVTEMRSVVSRYVFMTAIINVLQGLVIGLALKLLGYPSALLWGVMTFALEFIPYLGGMVMVGLLLVAGLAAGRDFPAAIYGPAAYLLVTSLQNNVLSPVLYGRSMRLNPTAILLGLMLWYMIWGVAGAFLAVPILAAFNVLAARVPVLHGVSAFLSE